MTHAIPSSELTTPSSIPWVEWDGVRSYVDKVWDPENAPHHSIIGLTGSGKSYLAMNGILKPMCAHDRVLIVDTKGSDPVSSTMGKPVSDLPRRTWYGGLGRRRDEPFVNWYRLVVSEDITKGRIQVHKALNKVYSEGDWVVYFDEIFDVTAPRAPSLNLLPWVDKIYRKGRYKRVSIVAGTQAPRWVPTSFYDQAAFAWIGRLRDEDKQKRLLEIGGLSKKELPYVASLKQRQWLLSAVNGEYFARTKVV